MQPRTSSPAFFTTGKSKCKSPRAPPPRSPHEQVSPRGGSTEPTPLPPIYRGCLLPPNTGFISQFAHNLCYRTSSKVTPASCQNQTCITKIQHWSNMWRLKLNKNPTHPIHQELPTQTLHLQHPTHPHQRSCISRHSLPFKYDKDNSRQ